MKKPMVNKKGKQQVQDKEVFLYKPYDVSLPRPKTQEPTTIQEEIKNLNKYIKYLQSLITTTLFYPPSYYKYI